MIRKLASPLIIATSCFFTSALIYHHHCTIGYAQIRQPGSENGPANANASQANKNDSKGANFNQANKNDSKEISATQTANKTLEPPDNLSGDPTAPQSVSADYGYIGSNELINTAMVTVIALIALSMQFILLKQTPKPKADDILRLFSITLIVLGTLFFITAGFDSIQIAPATGLFGTIAGYLLGKMDRKEKEQNE